MIDDENRMWTLKDIYDDLVSKQDLPQLLNVNKYRLKNWIDQREKYGSPTPIKRLAHIDVYSATEWKDWYQRWCEKKADNKNVVDAQPHGHGEAFWSYFTEQWRD